jgi:hypothetical protein
MTEVLLTVVLFLNHGTTESRTQLMNEGQLPLYPSLEACSAAGEEIVKRFEAENKNPSDRIAYLCGNANTVRTSWPTDSYKVTM